MVTVTELNEDFIRAAPGATITTENTMFTNVSPAGGTSTFIVDPFDSSLRMMEVSVASNTKVHEVNFPASEVLWYSVDIDIETPLSTSTALINGFATSAGTPDTSDKVFDVRQTAGARTLQLRSVNSAVWSSTELADNQKHRIYVYVKLGAVQGEKRIRLQIHSGTNINSLTPTQDSGEIAATTTVSTIGHLRLGAISSAVGVVRFGRTRGDNATKPTSVSNTPPAANAGVDQNTDPYLMVTINGSGTDTESTIVSYDWTAPAGITLSGTGAMRTFIGPPKMTDTTYPFSLVVTDSEGLSSAPDTMNVTVTRHNHWVVGPDGTTRLPRRRSVKVGTATSFATLTAPFYSAFNATTADDKAEMALAGFTHATIFAYWDRLEPTKGVLNTTAVAELRQEFDDAAAAGLDVIFAFANHYTPAWARTAANQFVSQAGTNHVGTAGTGNQVLDLVWNENARSLVDSFQNLVWNDALRTADKALIQGVRIGGGPFGELHYPNTGDWWGFSAPAQSGTNLASNQQVCPVPGYTPFSGNTTNDALFTEWYLDGLSNFLVWQVDILRDFYSGTVHVLHPGFGLRDNWTFGSANYRQQAAEGLDWERQIAAYPDAHVHPQSTWTNATHPWDPEGDEVFGADSDTAAWWKLRELAIAAGRAELMGGENTGGENNSDVDRMFSSLGAYADGRYAGLTWLNYPRLAGNEGTSHATLSHLSSYISN